MFNKKELFHEQIRLNILKYFSRITQDSNFINRSLKIYIIIFARRFNKMSIKMFNRGLKTQITKILNQYDVNETLQRAQKGTNL